MVIGASGQLGWEIFQQVPNAVGTYFSNQFQLGKDYDFLHLDISNKSEVKKVLKEVNPEVVFLTSSLTNVDRCEEHHEESFKYNVLGVKNVVDYLRDATDTRLIYISSDYIFDGKEGKYDEDAITNPVNVYGRNKLQSEHYILSSLLNFTIYRTSWLYGFDYNRKNFVYQVLAALKNNKKFEAPVDEFGTPTYIPSLVEVILKDLEEDPIQDIKHLAGKDFINRYSFAKKIADVFGFDENLIENCYWVELDKLANRPLVGGLSSKYEQPLMGVDEGLKTMFKMIGEESAIY